MDMQALIDALPTIAAVSSAIAALAALFVAWRAPIAAATYAEALRASGAKQDQERQLKFFVFSEMLKARGIRITGDSVAAMNLIDLAFSDSPSVRDAWAELYTAYSTPGRETFAQEKLHRLLLAMAEDIGLSSSLRTDDFERYYYPNILAELDGRTAPEMREKRVEE